MSSPRGRFNDLFGIKDTLEEERQRFVKRINQTAFNFAERESGYGETFGRVCYSMGENTDDEIKRYNARNFGPDVTPPLQFLTRDDFTQTLRVLALVSGVYRQENGKAGSDTIGKWVELALKQATMDLGVRWVDGEFRPSGAPLLDRALVDEVLGLVERFGDVVKDFSLAVQAASGKKWEDVVDRGYLAAEGMSRTLLSNKKSLKDNKADLLRKLHLSAEWGRLLAGYVDYANEFGRHASGKQHQVRPDEAEAFLYFTGLVLRLMAQAA